MLMRHLIVVVLVLLGVSQSCVYADETPAGLVLIADFDDGIKNRVGGYYNRFERTPSAASTFLASDVRRGAGGKSLRVTVDRRDSGFAGVWMHLFDFRRKPPQYFDARPYAYLSFWVKGDQGGEHFTVKIADAEWVAQEDALPVGAVADFLPGGVTTQWQEVLVPLKKFNTLDLANLAGLTLDFDSVGQHTVHIDDIALKTQKTIYTPETRSPSATDQKRQTYPKAMWVWSIGTLIHDEVARKELFSFCRNEGINQLWMQILYTFDPDINVSDVPALGDKPLSVRCVLHHEENFRRLLKEAHELGITVHALDGYPEYAQRIYHAMPLAIVDAIIDFNKRAQSDERFDGIHFDNEPYLIVGWSDADRRRQILESFLALNAECQKRVHEQSHMVFGVDIPFWWDQIDQRTGRPQGEVSFNGQLKPASFHCIDLLDNVGIMNYRDTADGADGMIAHGMDTLAYGDTVNKAKIYMGIETFAYDPTECWFAVGLPRADFGRVITGVAQDYAYLSRIDGYRFVVYDDGVNVHVGLEIPPNPDYEQKLKITKTMAGIARRFGASSQPSIRSRAEEMRSQAMTALESDPEWADARPRDIKDLDKNDRYAGVVVTSIMLPKVSFAEESHEQIIRQTAGAEDFFSRYKSYTGIAIHYYKTYRAKVNRAGHDGLTDHHAATAQP